MEIHPNVVIILAKTLRMTTIPYSIKSQTAVDGERAVIKHMKSLRWLYTQKTRLFPRTLELGLDNSFKEGKTILTCVDYSVAQPTQYPTGATYIETALQL